MAEEPNRVLAPEPPAEPLVYRPLSGLAITGLALACLFTGLEVISALAALVQGTPFFLNGWLVSIAVAGAVVSLLAQWHIRNSEDTRAGLALARWGFWLCLVAGLSYGGYYFASFLAITQQANDFVMVKDVDSGFFPRLLDGDPVQLRIAYLLTLPEFKRKKINPENEQHMAQLDKASDGKVVFSKFREHFAFRTIARAGTEATVEPLGVQNWSYEKRSYQVVRNYRITTPEAVFTFLLPVHSTEGLAGGQRKWFIPLAQMKPEIDTKFTPLGQALKYSYDLARYFIQKKAQDLNNGQSFGEYLDKTEWDKAVQGDLDGKDTRSLIEANFHGAREPGLSMKLAAEEYFGQWEVVNDRLRFIFRCQFGIKGPQNKPLSADATVIVEDQDPIPLDDHNRPDATKFSPQPRWRVAVVQFHRVSKMQGLEGMMMGGAPP